MSQRLHTLIFALLLSLVCSALLAAVSWQCQPRYKLNQELERKAETLNVFNVEIPEGASLEDIDALYAKHIKEVRNEKGNITAYRNIDPESEDVLGLGFPVAGKGLWGPIRGMIAMRPDLENLIGVRFLEHQETPGLGAKITTEDFLKQFEGQPVVNEQGEVMIRVIQASKEPANKFEVDGISGATLTGDGVTELLQREIKKFRERYQQ